METRKRVILVWFRNDLRLHDNEMLSEVEERASIVIPVYIFDKRYFSTNKYGNKNTGVLRAEFLRQSVKALRKDLQAMDSDLLVYHGFPEDILPRLAVKYEVDQVYHHREVAQRETTISELVETALWQYEIDLKHFIGHTLYHKEDLPFSVREIPEAFANFRKEIERESFVREPFPKPSSLLTPKHLEKTNIPSLEELGYDQKELEFIKNAPLAIKAGEKNALKSLKDFFTSDFWDNQGNITAITPYIASGTISPIYIYHKLIQSKLKDHKKGYEKVLKALFWRDYFRFMLKKHKNIFFKNLDKKQNLKNNLELLTQWKNGNTGVEQVDSIIQDLHKTGLIKYSQRKIVGGFLIQKLKQNWLEGASFFEEHLIDYEPASNYGYWAHIAGVGTSKKENKQKEWGKLV
ncbi:MAG TPA: deoxyribodipyrimidine photo-lyase [Candidatus Sphingobacterium stercoripullorum]|uniref:Deoxyribodipyrimidine photo-lyase n=1 Tax=Candidatus Sphingobacterium stercoripullorum TaxID=2838759 RepID=A0A9D2AXK2_9SPHI|nr:deoxyribodipyrimidine photo-lyase [Candidatus Sphingobacterium stercoripullorum]HLR48959.1 deoxyribodipyrimidine photo-lyase [Candidatus Sphingobacterium stercoripullorum]